MVLKARTAIHLGPVRAAISSLPKFGHFIQNTILALLHLFSHKCSCGPAHDEPTHTVQWLEKGKDRYNSSSISGSATCAILGKSPFSICKWGITAACISEVVWSSANWKVYKGFQSLGFKVLYLSVLSLVPEFMLHIKKTTEQILLFQTLT